MKETELVKQALWCYKVHQFSVLEPGKVTPVHLSSLSKGIVWRSNTGAMRMGRRFIRFGIAGMGDITGFTRLGRFLTTECKVGKNKLTEEQRMFKHWVLQAGGIYLEVRSYDDLDLSLKHMELNGAI